MEATDPRATYLLQQVAVSFKHVAPEKFGAFKAREETSELLNAFISSGEVNALFFYYDDARGGLTVGTSPPTASGASLARMRAEKATVSKEVFLYAAKLGQGQSLEVERYRSQVIVGEWPVGDALEFPETLARVIYAPLLAAAKKEWSEFVAREVDEAVSGFVANVQIMRGSAKGETCLPLPPDWAVGEKKERGLKDAVHALESAVVTWTKQIKAVLRRDPETSLSTPSKPHPGPVAELDFWADKARHLNCIVDQLQSTRVRRVLACLDKAQSTYNAPFAKLCKDLVQARLEANDTVKYLAPLREWVCKLEDASTDFEDLPALFPPIIHTILLVWRSSGYFNTQTRLVVFVREICNALVDRATVFLRNGGLFDLVAASTGSGGDAAAALGSSSSSQQQNNGWATAQPFQSSGEAVGMLKSALEVLAELKRVYLRYKDRALIECPENPWRAQNNAVFVRLDAFCERAHDVLDLARTVTQFRDLARIEVGGTKGKVLTTSLAQIHSDFGHCVEAVTKYGHDRLLDVEATEFDDALYEFRKEVKELERRLASVLTQGFDDAPTTAGRFKLLDSFDALVQRPVVAETLEQKYVELVVDYGRDVAAMQSLFVQQQHQKNGVPIAHNLPPIAGALTWARGLLERVSQPMRKLNKLEKSVMERDEARQIVKDYTAFLGQLADYERAQIDAWGESIEHSSQAKLKNPLLRFEPDASQPSAGLLYVNFDPLLVRLLREVKYFLLLGFDAPSSALEIYRHAEVFRRHMGNLDLIVNMYNWMQTSLLPVERPLLGAQLDALNKLLAQGVGTPQPGCSTTTTTSSSASSSSSGTAANAVDSQHHHQQQQQQQQQQKKSLTWKSSNIDGFINEAMADVKEVAGVITVVKANLRRIEDLLEAACKEPLLKRSGKAATVADFEQLQRVTLNQRYAQIRDCGSEVHALLDDSNKKLKVSHGLPDWRSYVDFIANVVVAKLRRAVVVSCAKLEQQLDPVFLTKNSPGPMLEIELDLVDKRVRYAPEIGFVDLAVSKDDPSKRGLKNIVRQLLEQFVQVGDVVRRLDGAAGGYVRELQDHPEVKAFFDKIERRLEDSRVKLEQLRRSFAKYEYLWTTDLQAMFDDFLKGARVAAETENDDKERAVNVEAEDSRVSDETDAECCDAAAQDDSDSTTQQNAQHAGLERLRLDLFDDKIREYLEVQAEIEELKPQHDVDFLRVVSQPIKQALSTWVTKWMYTFTNYLQQRIIRDLGEIHDFMAGVDAGLDAPVTVGDKDALMAVMTHVRDVRKRMPTMESNLAPLRDMVQLLKTHGIALDLGVVGDAHVDALEFLERAPMLWDNTVNKAFKVKEYITPLQLSYTDTIKRDITAFLDRAKLLHAAFRDDVLHRRDLPLETAYREIDRHHRACRKLESELAAFVNLQELFELHKLKSPHLVELRSELRLAKLVSDHTAVVQSQFRAWRQTQWADIDADDLLDKTKKLLSLTKQLPRRVRDWSAYVQVLNSVSTMASILPLVAELHSPALRDRHWKAVAAQTGKTVDMRPGFTLDDLLKLDLHLHVDAVVDIVETANKEHKVETKLQAIDAFWQEAAFETKVHRLAATSETDADKAKDRPQTGKAAENDGGKPSSSSAEEQRQHKGASGPLVVVFPDQVIETQEEQQQQLQMVASMGRAVDFFRTQLVLWQTQLGTIELVMRMFLSVQRAWASLEAIFLLSDDIRAQLPEQTARFEAVDAEFKGLMGCIVASPNVMAWCLADGREQALAAMTRELEVCQKALSEYLDVKKALCPRFYFISSAALLDILSNSNNPPRILPHLGGLFDGIATLDLAPVPKDAPPTQIPDAALAMRAKDGEVVKFGAAFFMRGAVEKWLVDLTEYMRATLRTILDAALQDAANWESDRPREDWVTRYPAQIALVASQIVWTEETETALDEYENGTDDACRKFSEVCTSRLEALIGRVQENLDKETRTKITTLITIDVHDRDVVQALVDAKTEGPGGFLWQKQLRTYYGDSKTCEVRICDFRTHYSYEYSGNVGRLVVTALTDRCYVTLTMALRLFLGGAPAGPAGTGKTETTKDLGRSVGVPVYVFNCSDQMNYQSLADIFRGLSQTGAWGCFDEFNRISIEVLSVVATQVKTVHDAKQRLSVPSRRDPEYQHLPEGAPPCKVGRYEFFGTTIDLVPTFATFITMNPGYAGRTELPENLKALFRSCAMVRPDLQPICENMLMAAGFKTARDLSIKFTTLYRLSLELLSRQAHYDWGLRAIKTVLLVAGKLKRADPHLAEAQLLMRALRDFNTPKVVAEDTSIFLRLIADLFPDVDVAPKVDESLRENLVDACGKAGLQAEDGFVLKALQLQEILDVRHSVMILGPAGCGKTAIWKTLADAHNLERSTKKTCVYETVNPQALNPDELYGCVTLAKDWKDGALSNIMRGMSQNSAEKGFYDFQTHKWAVLDGDIDAVWIESMNSVMDDNKVLTLVSNERVPLTESMRLVFETHSLENASPATVSRAGILFVNEHDVGYRPLVDSWLHRHPEQGSVLTKYLNLIPSLMPLLDLPTVIPVTPTEAVANLLNLLDAYAKFATPEALERSFYFAAVWAFGGASVARAKFSEAFLQVCPIRLLAPDSTVFDVSLNAHTGDWEAWSTPSFEPSDPAASFIHTASTFAAATLTVTLLSRDTPVAYVGGDGVGKTALAKAVTAHLAPEAWTSTELACNYFTTPERLETIALGKLDKISGTTYGPRLNKQLVCFLDDVNVTAETEFGTRRTVEALRQLVGEKTLFDRSDFSCKKKITGVRWLAAYNERAGAFPARCGRLFFALAVAPNSQQLSTVFTSLAEKALDGFKPAVQKMIPSLVQACLAVHAEVSSKFLPTVKSFHYAWSPRNLANVFRGVSLAHRSAVSTPLQAVRLVCHEIERSYSDRLVSENELVRCHDIIVDVAKRHFDFPPEEVFAEPNVFALQASSSSLEGGVDFSSAAHKEGVAKYTPVGSLTALKTVLEKALEEYNVSNPLMRLVFFKNAVEHVVRLTRILALSSCVLVGVGGSGRASLTRLASFLTNRLVYTGDFYEAFRRCGVKNEEATLLFADSQLEDDAALCQRVNDFLATGFCTELYSKDELDHVLSQVRGAAKASGVPDTSEGLLQFLVDRLKANLRIVLCASPVGDAFRIRARKFPQMLSNTVMDWYHPWPKDALVSVAQHVFEKVDFGDAQMGANVPYFLAEAHSSVSKASKAYYEVEKRRNYVTPTSYLELVGFCKSLLASRGDEMCAKIQRLERGVFTLRKTNDDVAELQKALKLKKIEVDKKRAECDEFLEKMGRQRGQAEVAQAEADRERAKADAAAKEARELEERAAGDLSLAKPALDAALNAVNCLDKASMTELKSFQKPPAGVDKVTTTLLILVKNEKTDLSWNAAKRMMAKVDAFKEQLEAFRGEDIPPDVVQRVEPYLADPNFTYEKMKSKSLAAANLCNWVVNIVTFHKVYNKVKPLMDQLEEAQASKQKADADLAKVETTLADIDAELARLQRAFLEATSDKAAVERVAKDCETRLALAERLTNGLASEYSRWGAEIDELRKVETTLVGDVLLSAAFVSYVGAFGASFRAQLTGHWIADLKGRGIPLRDSVDPVELLTTEAYVAEWCNQGLPADRMSVENGAVVANCRRWPLLIDPQLQGIRWIRKHEEDRLAKLNDAREQEQDASVLDDIVDVTRVVPDDDDAVSEISAASPVLSRKGTGGRGLKLQHSFATAMSQQDAAVKAPAPSLHVMQLGDKNWIAKLRDCVRYGQTAVLENLGERVDPLLEPVLQRAVFKKGRTVFLKVAGEDVEYDSNFKLYLQTRLANPRLKPEIAATCTLVNFIVTEAGLEDQLLAKVVSSEQPALEREKDDLVQAFNRYKIQLRDLEDDLLRKLANAPADILGDVPLIEGLEKTKATAAEILKNVDKGKLAEKGINEAREAYRSVAAEASQLYFLLLRLNKLDPMYQYSLASFTTFFYNGMRRAPAEAQDTKLRVDHLIASVRFTVYQWISRGLFERHRLVFLVQLCLALLERGLAVVERSSSQRSTTGADILPNESTPTMRERRQSLGNLPTSPQADADAISAKGGPLAKMCVLSGFSAEGLDFLLRGPKADPGPPAPAPWITDAAWGMLRSLSKLPGFEKLPADLKDSAPRFLEWFASAKPESEKLPLDWRDLDKRPFQKLLLVRCLRPDRLASALNAFVRACLPRGPEYADLDADRNSYGVLEQCFADASPRVPIYFLLSPGADVVADVDRLALKFGVEPGVRYHNVSLGQGQDVVALAKLENGYSKGHWCLLNNVHLMPTWLRTVEKLLDDLDAAGAAHPDFRLFLSSDPSPGIPVGILDRAIKITLDPPAGIKPNLRQAFCVFDRDEYEDLEPRTKGILFALCFFHAIMIERRKFGPQGANFRYPYAFGDLTASAAVLKNYMESAPSKVPWDDLKYLFGIMYGGHITNDLDGRVCSEYLNFFMRDDSLDEMDMFPYPDVRGEYFHAPQTSSSYDKVLEHIDVELAGDSPLAFGMHPNAEVGFRTDMSERLCRSILDLSPTAGIGRGDDSADAQNAAEAVLQDTLEQLRDTSLDVVSVKQLVADEPGPYATVLLQECGLMNHLLQIVVASLENLDLGFRGEITMTESMTALQESLFLDRVPAEWATAYPSERALASWLANIQQRIDRLRDWCAVPTDLPVVTWISGLIHPGSFLTAVMQVAANLNKLELDKLSVAIEVTKKNDASDFTAPSRDGAYVHGLHLEGARWNPNGMLEPALPREMTCPMPVINVKAALADRIETNIFSCPCYKTTRRGHTFVHLFGLKTKAPPAKWVLAGTALIMDIGS